MLYDGECMLCSATVRFLRILDRKNRLTLLPLAGNGQETETVRFIFKSRIYHRSEALLRMLMALGGAGRLAVMLFLFPRFFRDALYNVIARNRYRFFGRTNSCAYSGFSK